MLRNLILKNFILVEDAEIPFSPHFTVISGESGSGKTAIIKALKLILGKRTSTSMVRKGCDRAMIQALFSQEAPLPLLDEAGVYIEDKEELIITREIQRSGKSRCFINGTLVPLQLLGQLSSNLIDFVDQHSHAHLRQLDSQRDYLDLFGHHAPLIAAFQKAWNFEKGLHKQLQELKEQNTEERKSFLSTQIQELEEANVQENEEEKLFEEYSKLSNAQELLRGIHEVLEKKPLLFPQISLLDSLIKYDKNLEEVQKMFKEANLQIEEATYQLHSLKAAIDPNPRRLQFLEERLKLISSLKKRYGSNLADALSSLTQKLNLLESAHHKIEELTYKCKEAKNQADKACRTLTEQRAHSALKLEKKLSEALKQLNIPHAEVKIQIKKTHRTQTGEDESHFFLRANLGERSASIKESTSGGELARLLFCLKTTLAEKNPTTAMIFDEIDANVGGETASIIGKKLQELGKKRQVISITHFPQVAKYANHNIRVYKQEGKERTSTKIEVLKGNAKDKELLRMVGGLSQFS